MKYLNILRYFPNRREKNGYGDFRDNRGMPKKSGFKGAKTGAEGGRQREFDRHSGSDKRSVR